MRLQLLSHRHLLPCAQLTEVRSSISNHLARDLPRLVVNLILACASRTLFPPSSAPFAHPTVIRQRFLPVAYTKLAVPSPPFELAFFPPSALLFPDHELHLLRRLLA